MITQLTFVYLLIAILIALLVKPLVARLYLPFPLALVIIGFLISEFMVSMGIDTGIRAHNFETISHYIFIPILLFASAYQLSPKLLWNEKKALFLLALPVPIITFIVTTIALYFSINHPTGFPWIAAAITAALLVNINARAIIELLEQLKVSPRITHLLEGESIFSDVSTIILFQLFLSMALMENANISLVHWPKEFLMLFLGGVLIGIFAGFITLLFIKLIKLAILQGFITIVCVYLCFVIADDVFHVSGPVSVFCMGIILSALGKQYLQEFCNQLWQFNLLLASTCIFLLVGATITISMFEERWLAMIIGLIAIIIGRAIAIYTSFGTLRQFNPQASLDWHEQTVMIFSGMRGALTIALAFAIPTSLDYWWTIQSIAFGVVLFSLVIKAPTVSAYLLIKKYTEKCNKLKK